MSDFVSWYLKNVGRKETILYLNDNDIFNTKAGKELQEYCGRERDFCGHGSIARYYELTSEMGLKRNECSDFSSPKNFPPEIVKDIKELRMVKVSYSDKPFAIIGLLKREIAKEVKEKIDKYYRQLETYRQYSGKTIAEDIWKDQTQKGDSSQNKKDMYYEFSKDTPANGEALFGNFCGGHSSILKFFKWTDTKEGHSYWDALTDARYLLPIKERYEKGNRKKRFIKKPDNYWHDIIWKLFEDKKNRKSSWR